MSSQYLKEQFSDREDPKSKVGYEGNSRREEKSGAQVRDLQTRLGKVKLMSRLGFGFLLHILLEAICKVKDSKIKINFKMYKSHWKFIEEFTLKDVEGQKLKDIIGGYCKNLERYKGVLGKYGQWLQYWCILNEN